MDGQRFDNVTRLIGTGASRRRVLKGLAAGLFGLSGAGVALRDARAGNDCVLTGNSCVSDDSECCGDGDGVVCAGVPRMCANTLSCVGGTGPCNVEKGLNCCEGLVCEATDGANGACVAAPPECAAETENCATTDDCCEGLVCEDNACVVGAASCKSDDDCAKGEVCNADSICETDQPELECTSDRECVGPSGAGEIPPICCGGVCVQIACCIEDEDPNARCGENEVCFEGYCDPVCGSDSDCAEDACCCPDGSCSGHCCEPIEDEDTGGEIKLPNTGAGRTQGSDGLIGAGILAAGAVYLAGKKLRTNEDS